MSVYTERWIARPAWLELSVSERIAYLDRMDEAFRSLSDSGAKLIGLVLDEEEGEGYERCHYVAVWLMPEGEGLERRLNEILGTADWYDYFDPVIAAPADPPAARMSSFRGQRQPDEV